MNNKRILLILCLLFIGLLNLQLVIAESKYTHENSEKLFHLINWYEYEPETFEIALEEQKPIFLLLSAPAWCYWCHVYESEDYLFHPELYPYINENFIPIFVDTDKRPDLQRKYLEGGWPSTTIFSPDFRRIQGFVGPRDPQGLKDYFEQVVEFLKDKDFEQLNFQVNYQETEPKIPGEDELIGFENTLAEYALNIYDPLYGGFGTGDAPAWREGQKFPRPFTLKFLLEKYEDTGDEKFLEIVKNTFENQYTRLSEIETRYHLYDPVEGGFHRYGTKRDWSVPHYEKMLHDQAKFIAALTHLDKIENNDDVKTALSGTINYVLEKLYDDEGGFYSSQDAYLEDEYYGQDEDGREQIKPPFIDKTRKIDSNSMMISSLLYSYGINKDEKLMDAAEKSLDFISDKMVDGEGAYFYYDYEKKKPFLTGQSIANSWALLAFVDGYRAIKKDLYLVNAKKIADYSLANLYDWKSGVFFERNSKDTDFYAPNEQIDLSKPYPENGVFSYSMLRLYLITKDLEYLEAGMKTLGYMADRPSGLDESYYAVKASQLARENNLLDDYNKNINEINKLVEKRKDDFFLNELIGKKQNIVSLENPPMLKSEFMNAGFIVLALLALFAGILSLLSPCTLPVLTAYFAQGINSKKGETLKNTLLFFLGLAIVFSIFGMGATLIGSILRENRIIFTQIAGLLIITFGIFELFGKGFSGFNIRFKGHKTSMGPLLFGAVFAIGWSACIGPILASLLILSATSGTIISGSALLFIYSIGLGIPLIIIALYFDKIKNKRFWHMLQGKEFEINILVRKIKLHTTYVISGIILIILGILIFNDYLFKLNEFALQSSFVQEFIIKGEEFLKRMFL